MTVKTVSILVYDDVEVLDFAGPFEVFSVAGFTEDRQYFHPYLIAENDNAVLARGGFSINPSFNFSTAPQADILVVPGGPGSRQECNNAATQDYVRSHYDPGGVILSVCTG